MRIKVIESSSRKPLTNVNIQLQVKGKDSGYLSFTTDDEGCFELDDKYRGQQIAHYLQGKMPSSWVTADDDAELIIAKESVKEKSGFTTGSF